VPERTRIKRFAGTAEPFRMAAEAPMLFAPPLAPVRVEPGCVLTLGRSPECSLQLPAAGASRRHASVGWRDGAVVLRDLGSTNGTYLNGERVLEEATLRSGDKIRIGGLEILFCCVEAGTAVSAVSDGNTVVSFWPGTGSGGEALRGNLEKVPLFAVLQMLEMGRQSGCLAVDTAAGEGYLWLEAGRIVHAESGKRSGLEAALAITQANTGRFDFAPGSPAPERSFGASVTEVILEATRLLDEEGGAG
jgi:pSer/pThr/pTyr-binding forkhead associated (FHA) protein